MDSNSSSRKQQRVRKGKQNSLESSTASIFAKMDIKSSSVGRKRDSFPDIVQQKASEIEPPVKVTNATISSTINRLKKQVDLYRTAYVKMRMEVNSEKVQRYSSKLLELSQERGIISNSGNRAEEKDLLFYQIQKSLCKVSGLDTVGLERDGSNESDEDGSNVFFAFLNNGNNSLAGKTELTIRLPAIQQYPPYTTWIFLDRNQKMPEDQSVVGRRRIYYDQNGSEALICSDSEEEAPDDDDDLHEFSKGEDYILWTTIENHGLDEAVLKSLANCMDAEPSEVEARYEVLQKDEELRNECLHYGTCGEEVKFEKGDAMTVKFLLDNDSDKHTAESKEKEMDDTSDKDLSAAMDSFDNLFCRRCLVFDCRLHGCSQPVITPSDKQPPLNNFDGSRDPCGPDCYLLLEDGERLRPMDAAANEVWTYLLEKKGSSWPTQLVDKKEYKEKTNVGKQEQDVTDAEDRDVAQKYEIAKKGRKPKKSPKRRAEEVLVNIRKKQSKVAAADTEHTPSKLRDSLRTAWRKTEKAAKKQDGAMRTVTKLEVENKSEKKRDQNKVEGSCKHSKNDESKSVNPIENLTWSKLEKGLYEKGLEIFGKNSCSIARNMLKGMKTCREVAEYLACQEMATKLTADDSHIGHGTHGKTSERENTGVRTRTRFWQRRGRVRRLKYTWKSAGHPAIRKRTLDSKDQPCKQYTPCACKFSCGKTCSCILNGTSCEKYCGCSKSCKNRFRGCHCAKSQCRTRQCPCFAGGRECDPDVCRNCWVGCGDGTLGGPPQRGDNYDCQNMKLLLRQQQRVLLGRSDVAGWGAFLRNSVSRHDYLGEYTGELISHREADKRGKIYDRENSSFLFNLNDQFVLDAYRKGDKLKFANHSPNPNCYAKVIMVAGDHRVGIFAKDRILAGEELFYDYRYEADRAPVWAKKPEGSTTKKEESFSTGSRAQKVA